MISKLDPIEFGVAPIWIPIVGKDRQWEPGPHMYRGCQSPKAQI